MFHDSGRERGGKDLWDCDSALLFYAHLKKILDDSYFNQNEEKIRLLVEAVANKDAKPGEIYFQLNLANPNEPTWEEIQAPEKKNIYQKVIHDADCLDIIRVRPRSNSTFLDLFRPKFSSKYLDFCKEVEKEPNEEKKVNFKKILDEIVEEADHLIEEQGDKRFGSKKTKNERLTLQLSYENENAYQLLEESILQRGGILSKLSSNEPFSVDELLALVEENQRNNEHPKKSFFQRNPFISTGIISSLIGLALGIALSFVPGVGPFVGAPLIKLGLDGLILTVVTAGICAFFGALAGSLGTLIGKGISFLIEACCFPKSGSMDPGNNQNIPNPLYSDSPVGVKQNQQVDQGYIEVISTSNENHEEIDESYENDTNNLEEYKKDLERCLRNLNFIIFGNGAAAGWGKNIPFILNELSELKRRNPEEHNHYISSHEKENYRKLYEMFPNWEGKRNLIKKYEKMDEFPIKNLSYNN